MNRKKYHTIILMPYLPLDGALKFSNLIIWPYHKKKNDFIKDKALREHLDKLVGSYQFQKGGPIQNPAVVSVTDVNFQNPTRLSIAKIEALKNILLLTGILEMNQWSFVTSDNFEVYYQRFNVGDEHISMQGGVIHKIIAGGYKVGEVAFLKPEYVNIPLGFRLSDSVIKALEDCLINSSTDEGKSQVIQGLSPFFNAYRNSHEQSAQSRILLLIMAFELLFGASSRPNFRNNILKYATLGYKRKFKTYKYPIVNYGRVTGHEQLTMHQIWAEEFYKLRHKIIHGDTVYSDDFIFKELSSLIKPREPHFYIAVNFFVVCVLNKLRELGFDILHLAIDPEAKEPYSGKKISGINNEQFKIVRVNPFQT